MTSSTPLQETAPQAPLKVLALIPKSFGSPARAELKAQVESRLGTMTGKRVEVTDSIDWHRGTFGSSGGWDDWIWNTVSAVDYTTRKTKFDAFVTCVQDLGRANAGIVKLALRNGRAVLHWKDQEPLAVVQKLDERDSDDWVGGWRVCTTQIQG